MRYNLWERNKGLKGYAQMLIILKEPGWAQTYCIYIFDLRRMSTGLLAELATS